MPTPIDYCLFLIQILHLDLQDLHKWFLLEKSAWPFASFIKQEGLSWAQCRMLQYECKNSWAATFHKSLSLSFSQ